MSFLSFIFDILEKKDPELISLETKSIDFWKSIASVSYTKHNILSLFPYSNPHVKKAVLSIKKSCNQRLLETLCLVASEYLIDELSERFLLKDFYPTLLIAIPASNNHKGFNHSEEIVSLLHKQSGLSHITHLVGSLRKIKRTQRQHSLRKVMRLTNLKDSIQVRNPKKIKGNDILLIDDVVTTGATFEEAIRALHLAGARKIVCLALAH